MTTSNREKDLAIITAVLIVLAVIFSGIIRPQLKHRTQLIQQKTDLELLATQTQTNLYLKNRVERKHDAVVKSLTTSNRSENYEISIFFDELKELYEKYHLTHKSENTLPTQHQKAYRVLSIKIELQGNVNHILGFIHSIEEAEVPLGIASCEIKAQDQRDTVKALFKVSKIIAES